MHLYLKRISVNTVPINVHISTGTCYLRNICKCCLIRDGQIRKSDPCQDPGQMRSTMPSCCDTPRDHIREHLLSTSHVATCVGSIYCSCPTPSTANILPTLETLLICLPCCAELHKCWRAFSNPPTLFSNATTPIHCRGSFRSCGSGCWVYPLMP